MTNPAHILAERLKRAVHLYATEGTEPTADSRSPLPEQACAFLADGLVQTARRYVETLIREEHVRADMLAAGELYRRIPLDAAQDAQPDAQHLLASLAQAERLYGGAEAWPPEVTQLQAAALLDRVKTPAASAAAKILREGHGQVVYVMGAKRRPLGYRIELRSVPRDFLELDEWDRNLLEMLRAEGDFSEDELRNLAATWPAERAIGVWHPPTVALLAALEDRVRRDAEILQSPAAAARFAWALVNELAGPEGRAKRTQISKFTLNRVAEKNDAAASFAQSPRAHELLEETLRKNVDHLRESLHMNEGTPPTSDEEAVCLEEGIFREDNVLAKFLEKLGEQGARLAVETRRGSTSRMKRFQTGAPGASGEVWDLWADPKASPAGCRFAQALSIALWHDKIAPQLQREYEKPPALIYAVAESIIRVASSHLSPGTDEQGREALVRPGLRRRDAPLVVADMPALSSELFELAGLKLFGSRLMFPFIEWMAEIAHLQAVNNSSRPDMIEREGGWERVTAEVLMQETAHPNDRVKLRDLARVGANTPIRWSDGARSSSLFWMRESEGKPGNGRGRARITFKVDPRLLPHETFEVRDGTVGGRERSRAGRLVPVMRPRIVPTLERSSHDTYGPQAVFSRGVWLYITEQGEQLLDDGGVEITEAKALELAHLAHLPERIAVQMLPHLVNAKVLSSSGKGRYAPTDESAAKLIREGWERSRTNRGRGRKSGLGRKK